MRPYAAGDFALLQATLGVAEMTSYLGGPESAQKLEARHQRYVELPTRGNNRMFVILAGEHGQPAGTIGFWEHEYQGEMQWETGWAVLPAFQGQGIATAATHLVIETLRQDNSHRYVLAYPTLQNAASNSVCRKAGFELLGQSEYEYPPGNPVVGNVWRLDLQTQA